MQMVQNITFYQIHYLLIKDYILKRLLYNLLGYLHLKPFFKCKFKY